ncbi:MAG: YtxH domain-containing protein [Syntrophobacterales bacterium]|jgi:gas vesicle protein|nr:YtxH domain-containing protein [Syntrophobacterales bacterium]
MAQNENNGFSAGSVLLSFFVGGLLGAGVALLLAPKSGKETRQQLKDLAEDVKTKADCYMEQMKEQASSVMEKGKDLLKEQKSIIASAVEAGKEAYTKEKDKLTKE